MRGPQGDHTPHVDRWRKARFAPLRPEDRAADNQPSHRVADSIDALAVVSVGIPDIPRERFRLVDPRTTVTVGAITVEVRVAIGVAGIETHRSDPPVSVIALAVV